MPGLDPGIHAFLDCAGDVDGRVKPGHDVSGGADLAQVDSRQPSVATGLLAGARAVAVVCAGLTASSATTGIGAPWISATASSARSATRRSSACGAPPKPRAAPFSARPNSL